MVSRSWIWSGHRRLGSLARLRGGEAAAAIDGGDGGRVLGGLNLVGGGQRRRQAEAGGGGQSRENPTGRLGMGPF